MLSKSAEMHHFGIRPSPDPNMILPENVVELRNVVARLFLHT